MSDDEIVIALLEHNILNFLSRIKNRSLKGRPLGNKQTNQPTVAETL